MQAVYPIPLLVQTLVINHRTAFPWSPEGTSESSLAGADGIHPGQEAGHVQRDPGNAGSAHPLAEPDTSDCKDPYSGLPNRRGKLHGWDSLTDGTAPGSPALSSLGLGSDHFTQKLLPPPPPHDSPFATSRGAGGWHQCGSALGAPHASWSCTDKREPSF